MNEKKTVLDKVAKFVFGDPIPVLSHDDIETVYSLNKKIETLLTSLEENRGVSQPLNGQINSSVTQPQTDMDGLTNQVKKLAKTQFKANTLQESQLAQQQETLDNFKKSIGQQKKLITDIAIQQEQAIEEAQWKLIKGMLPVLDSLDAAFNSGCRQVLNLPMSKEIKQAIIAWLDGIRLSRIRLLDLMSAYNIKPIPTIGQPFDPHYHIAVAIDTTGKVADGVIINEDQRGYASPVKVLREAKVVVARSD